MKLTKYEQETILLFNEEEREASVYTCDEKWKSRLRMMAETYPEDCRFVSENEAGGETYYVNKQLLTIRKPYSKERKQLLRDQALSQKRKPPYLRGVTTP